MATYNDARRLQDRLTLLERRMLAVETTSRLESASVGSGGISVYEGGTVDLLNGGEVRIGNGGSITVHGGSLHIRGTGEMLVDGTAEFNSTTTLSGNTTFGGKLDITSGSLVLPEGSIESNALAEQLQISYNRATRTNFGLSTTQQNLINFNISAPSWATRAAVMMQGFMIARYTGQGNYGAYISGNCAGSMAAENSTQLGWNENGLFGNTGHVSWSNTVTNPGSSLNFTLRARAVVNGEMGTSTSSYAALEAIAFFMR